MKKAFLIFQLLLLSAVSSYAQQLDNLGWVIRDNTWSVLAMGDDNSSGTISLPFNFCFYGTPRNSVYVNNNGNISFGQAYGTFSATGFPVNDFPIIAPFWADVDTRATGGGYVYYKVYANIMVVQWDSVEHYNKYNGQYDNFQLIITDGTSSLVQGGNISFTYKDMQWTTGDASGGSNGFGGSPAEVGLNNGDGIHYSLVGKFNDPSSTFNGPNTNSGVGWLRYKTFILDGCSLGTGFFQPDTIPAIASISVCPGTTIAKKLLNPAPALITGTMCDSAAENNTLILTSPAGTYFDSVLFASYGNASGSCGNFSIGSCNSSNSVTSVSNYFLGHYTDTLLASSNAFGGDPCLGTTKKLSVQLHYTNHISYYWYGSNPNIGLPVSGIDSIPSFTAINASNNPVADTISVVQLFSANGLNHTGNTRKFIITVNPLPAMPTASSNSAVCAGQTLNLTTPAVSGMSYNWTGPNGFSSASQNPSIPNATTASSGTYSVTLTNTGTGCTSAAGTTGATVNPLPATPVASSNSAVCVGAALNLSTTATGVSYAWTGPNSFTSSMQNPAVSNVTVAAAGTYNLNVTNTATGCTSAAGTTTVVVNPLPAVPTAGSNSPVCTGQALNLNAATATGGATYSWTGPNSFTSTSQNPVIGNAAATAAGSYTVYTLLNGCQSAAATVNVSVNTTPAISSSSFLNPSACSGSDGSITLNGMTGSTAYTVNYIRNGIAAAPLNINSTAGGVITIPNLSAGAYTNITVGSGSGCTSAPLASVTLTDPALPASPVVSSNSAVCAWQTLNLSTPSIPGVTYSWTGPNSFSSALQNPSITSATVAASGTYSLIVTNTATGCTSTPGTATVIVNPLPATPVAGSNSAVCIGQTLNLNTASVVGVTYNWAGPNSFSSIQQNPSVASVTTAAGGTYSVTITNTATGCTSAAGTTAVVVNPLPATPVAGSNSPVCAGQTLNLNTASVTGITYSWSGPNSFSSTQQNPFVTSTPTAASGNYSVTLTNITTGCTSFPGTTAVTVKSLPVAPIAGSNSPVCLGQSLNLTATYSSNGATYNWSGSNSFTSTNQNPSINNVTSAATGTYTVYTLLNGCQSAASNINVIIDPQPAATITAGGALTFCADDSVQLYANTGNGLSYAWKYNNAAIANASDSVHKANVTGSYTVMVTDSNGCSNTSAAVAVTVNPLPPSIITYTTSIIFCKGGAVVLTAFDTPGYTFQWSLNNTPIANATDYYNISGLAGAYTVKTTNTFGCTAISQPVNIIVNPLPQPVITRNGSQLVTGTFVSNQWYLNNNPIAGATGQSFTFTQDGGYYVIVTDNNGCTGNSSVIFVDNVGVATQHIAPEEIKIYPNPVHQFVHIDAPVAVNAIIRDLAGRIILTQESGGKIDMSNIADGIYLLSVTDERGNLLKTEKLFKSQL